MADRTPEKDPQDWVTGDEPMTGPQQSYLETLAREELGLNPDDLGSPLGAATTSFLAFAAGALLPLLPFISGTAPVPPVATAAAERIEKLTSARRRLRELVERLPTAESS